MRAKFTYEYARPAVAADCIIFGWEDTLEVLLMQRAEAPAKSHWVLPGAFVRENEETPEATARRTLHEKIGGEVQSLFLASVEGAPERDSRGHVISIGYVALVRKVSIEPFAGSNAQDARWFPIEQIPALAFDHSVILRKALAALRMHLRTSSTVFDLLPCKFKLTQMRSLWEQLLGKREDVRNFAAKARRLQAAGIILPAGREENVPHRPATLYSLNAPLLEGFLADGEILPL